MITTLTALAKLLFETSSPNIVTKRCIYILIDIRLVEEETRKYRLNRGVTKNILIHEKA
jgi:hypothetical protein